ncbi:hypothetical protein C5167_000831 [Papaver somniferum]|uniref:Uncharacterized protein n=1 Tax=Papaver somniferum TaxID=3469 RepID=A0A4Y7KWZ4_PAPSO|nr:hypothetical protein C5167_000831 [Papaver somniferum]
MGSLSHDQQHRISNTSNLYPPPMGYWMTGGAYGAIGGAYGVPGLAQPSLILSRGPTPAGMATLSMLLPDGLSRACGVINLSPQPKSGRSGSDPGSRGYDSSDRSCAEWKAQRCLLIFFKNLHVTIPKNKEEMELLISSR